MSAAWDAGVRLFDTARSYGYGEAEGLLGEFLVGKRAEATIVTKFGILPTRTAAWKRWAKPVVRAGLNVLPQARGLVRKAIAGEMSAGHFDVTTLRSSLETSLRELKTDYVDVLLMHEPPMSAMAQEDLMAELGNVVSEGKARRVGVAATMFVYAGMALELLPTLASVQFPANFADIPFDELKRLGTPGPFAMGNHLFGGVSGLTKTCHAIEAVAKDKFVAAGLREKLVGDPMQHVAQLSFDAAFRCAGAHVVIPSMLHQEHVRANVTAVQREVFSPKEVEAVWKRSLGIVRSGRAPA